MDRNPLDIARYLAACGVPIFLARPSDDFPHGGSDGGGYWLPSGWQNTLPDPRVLDDYREGDAVCAVMGHVVDALDLDPRSGGEIDPELRPRSWGTQQTPSGGTHDLITPLGVRSINGVLPGVDVKAGVGDYGRGFIYIAPTRRVDKRSGDVVEYYWSTPPALEELLLVGGDETGHELRNLITRSRRSTEAGLPSYTGAEYSNLPANLQKQAADYVNVRLDMWRKQLDNAATWAEGERDSKGRGWEALARDAAWAVASMAITPWSSLTPEQAPQVYQDLLPEVIATDPKCSNKWYDGLLEKASEYPVDQPPWADFETLSRSGLEHVGLPERLDEAHLSEWLINIGLENKWCWSPGVGWMEWDGRRWSSRPDESALEVVRKLVIDLNIKALESGLDRNTMKQFHQLLSLGKIKSLTTLMKGVLTRDPSEFNRHPHLLSVGNGVVDLRTGELLPHDPEYLITRTTDTNYVPGSTHRDWDQVLTALEPEVADWMQYRFGQAATGEPTSDDVLPICQGGGSNGKTTLIAAIKTALGEHVTLIPDKLLRAGPNDHPTELMTLHGARMAFIDETPEVAQLNVQRVKSVLGSEFITARQIRKDNITWRATHSLFVMTNYVPIVRETDHGTWRRMALVKFDKTFPRNDRFRARVLAGEDGRKETVLAWVVQGAIRWYQNQRVIPSAPAKVQEDTNAWRGESDVLSDYLEERIVFDIGSRILTTELLEDVNQWLHERGMQPWGDQLLASRLASNEQVARASVSKIKTRDLTGLDVKYASQVPSRPRVWVGMRWRKPEDDLL